MYTLDKATVEQHIKDNYPILSDMLNDLPAIYDMALIDQQLYAHISKNNFEGSDVSPKIFQTIGSLPGLYKVNFNITGSKSRVELCINLSNILQS